jgi:hypothetical protein
MSSDETIVWDGLLTLELPRDWENYEEDGVITICHPDGVGALQFSFASGTDGTMPDVEEYAAEFARDHGLDAAVQRNRLGGFAAAYVEGQSCQDERDFWRAWYAARPNRQAFVTYNCPAESRDRERDAIDGILATARFA